VEQFSGEFMELIDASSIYEPQRQELKEAILTILLDGLMPAFEHLKKIRSSIGQDIPVLNRKQLYEDFYGDLWRGYKKHMPKATILLGFDLGFLFQKEASFKKGVAEFNKMHPSFMQVCGYLRQQRINWQEGLKDFRNELEHGNEGQEMFANYYELRQAEFMFDSAWRAMADIFPVFIVSHFSPSHSVEEIPASERNPLRPRRFRHIWLGTPPKPRIQALKTNS
jgi:hypothetical protein